MAEHDPPAAKVEVPGRGSKRRRARKGRGRKGAGRPAGPGKPASDADPQGVPAQEPRESPQTDSVRAGRSRKTNAEPREDKVGKRNRSSRASGRAGVREPDAGAKRARAGEGRGSSARRGGASSESTRRADAIGRAETTGRSDTIGQADAVGQGVSDVAVSSLVRRTPGVGGGAGGASGHGSGHGSGRQAYAAIDLGTNNCRLLIARPSGENFTVIDAFSRVVRLGEGLAQSGELSEAAMDRTLAALKVCADKLMRRNVYLARSVATEACRRASNGRAFIERVRAETGIQLDIISAREEARLAVLGCHVLLEEGMGPAMIFDIGGGSTELVLIESTDTVPRILDWQSVPWGVVSLTESCEGEGATLADRERRYAHMRDIVAESFAGFNRRIASARENAAQDGPLRLLGTSGTVTTLASLHLELAQYDRRLVDGLVLPAESMRAICSRLSTMAIEERRELNCIGRERADLVVAGCAILDTILDLWPAVRLGVADRGIREGILRSLMAAHSPSYGPATGYPAATSHILQEASAPMSKS